MAPRIKVKSPAVETTISTPSVASTNTFKGAMNTAVTVQSRAAHIDVRTLNIYDFVMDSYTGRNGFRDGAYIIPHPKEAFYDTRRKSSFYKNYFKAVINAMVVPVFSQDIKRENTDAAVQAFIEDCDGAGTPLARMIELAITQARTCGVSFVVMDTYAAQPDTVADAVEQRRIPYIYTMLPQMVRQHTTIHGKLVSIMFVDRVTRIGDKDEQTYRRWDADKWQVVVEKNSGANLKPDYVVIEEGYHGLGVLPVVAVPDFSNTAALDRFPDPPLYDLAGVNFSIYNRESEIRNMEQTQAFSTLCVQDNGGDVVLGTNNYLSMPMDAKIAPMYISPDSAHLVNLVNNCDKAREDLYRIAEQNGVVAVKSEASGVAKEWDFRAHEAVLRQTAQAAERVEYALVDLFGRYMGGKVVYKVTYPSEFAPNVSTNRIDLILRSMQEAPPSEVALALWKEYTKEFWRHDEERRDEVLEMLETAAAISRNRTENGEPENEKTDNDDEAGPNGEATEHRGEMMDNAA